MRRMVYCAAALVLTACPDDGNDGDSASTTSSGMTMGTPTSSSGGGSSSSSPTDQPGTTEDPSGTTTDDPSGTTTDEPGGTTTGEADGSSTGSGLGTVSGVTVRVVEPAAGEDAIGDLYVGLLATCTLGAETVGEGAEVIGADFSAPGAEVEYTITNVPDGTHYIVAFLDDDLNTDPDNPDADMGDLATAQGFGPGCVEVTVTDGADVIAPANIELNIVVPF